MSGPALPTVILGGSDRRAVELPASGRGKHPLAGYKGVDVHVGARPLIEVLAERLEVSGRFTPLYIAGPRAVYGGLRTSAAIIETDASFGHNIQVALERVRAAHPGSPIAFSTCDILPEVATLVALANDYGRTAPCDLWFALVKAPEQREQLGASAWKPAYRIVVAAGEPPMRVLPGHLLVADPEALRLEFLYRLFQLGYRTRNRPISQRRPVMVRGVMWELLYEDVRHLMRGQAPTLTWSVLRTGLSAARGLQAGTLTLAQLEDALRRIFVRFSHRRRYPERRIRLVLADSLSLARDIDTEEEAREVTGETA